VSDVLRGCYIYEDASDFQTIIFDTSRWSGVSLTSRARRTRGIWRTTRQTDKRAAYIVNFRTNLAVYGKVNGVVGGKLLPWNTGLTVHTVMCSTNSQLPLRSN